MNRNKHTTSYKKYYTLNKALEFKSKTAPFPFIIAHECREEYFDNYSKETKVRTRDFVAFNDVETFQKHRGIFPHSHEVLFNRFGDNIYAKLQGRLIFDFDFDLYMYGQGEYVHPGFEKTIEELIIKTFNKYYVDVDVDKFLFVWLISDTDKKWSKHLIIKGAMFCEDWKTQIQIFYQLMLSESRQLMNEYGNPILDYIDPSTRTNLKNLVMDRLFDYQVARNNATMRMYGSSKIDGKVLKMDTEHNLKTNINFCDTLIQQFDPNDIDVEQTITMKQLCKNPLEKAYDNPQTKVQDTYLTEACILADIDLTKDKNNYDNEEASDDEIKSCIKSFDAFWCDLFEVQTQDVFKVKNVDGTLIALERLRSHKCPLSEKVHDNDNAFLTILGGRYYFHCYRKCKKDGKSFVYFENSSD